MGRRDRWGDLDALLTARLLIGRESRALLSERPAAQAHSRRVPHVSSLVFRQTISTAVGSRLKAPLSPAYLPGFLSA